MTIWWRECGMGHMLRGSRKDVYEMLCNILGDGKQPSVMGLAHLTGWSSMTVMRSLWDLRDWGMIRYEQIENGKPAVYEILNN